MRFAFLFPRFKTLSGAERLILKLAEALIAKGHSIDVLCHQFDDSCKPVLPAAANLRMTGLKLDYFRNRYANAAFDYIRSNRLADLIPNGQPASLDAVCCFGPALAAINNIREKTSAPLLYFCYEPPRFLYTDSELIKQKLGAANLIAGPAFAAYRHLDRKRVLSARTVLSNSNFGREQIKNIYNRDATVITHGLDDFRESRRTQEIRTRFGIGPDDILVITVNYLHPRKRIELFVQAVKEAQNKDPRIKGLIAGDGPERSMLQSISGNAIHFAGFVSESELADYYQAADLYLHTARLETFGLSVIEASGNRLPVVSVNEGGPLETVQHEKTGLLVSAESTLLSKAILTLSADRQLRLNFGATGFESVRRKYQWSKGADDFLQAVTKTNVS